MNEKDKDRPIQDPAESLRVMEQRADAANKARIAKVGVNLMNAYNRGRTDPSEMAILGHDTATGYEFYVVEDGVVVKVDLTRDRN